MYQNVILTDVDGVLLNWPDSFEQWMSRHGLYPIDGMDHHYSIKKRYGLSHTEKEMYTRMFNESAAIGYLPPLRDAMYYVDLLHRKHGYVFHAITSLSLEPTAGAARTENLKRLFGQTAFQKFTYLDTGADKHEALEPYCESGCYWLEDKIENCEVGLELGLNSVLMAHDHNVGYKGSAPRVQNWKEIYGMITKNG